MRPLTTGGAALCLERREPQLNDLIRRGKLSAPPPVIAGRRLWLRSDILLAARDLGLDEAVVAKRLDEPLGTPGAVTSEVG